MDPEEDVESIPAPQKNARNYRKQKKDNAFSGGKKEKKNISRRF